MSWLNVWDLNGKRWPEVYTTIIDRNSVLETEAITELCRLQEPMGDRIFTAFHHITCSIDYQVDDTVAYHKWYKERNNERS